LGSPKKCQQWEVFSFLPSCNLWLDIWIKNFEISKMSLISFVKTTRSRTLHKYKMIFKDWIRWWDVKVKIQQLVLLCWNGVSTLKRRMSCYSIWQWKLSKLWWLWFWNLFKIKLQISFSWKGPWKWRFHVSEVLHNWPMFYEKDT